MQIAFTTIEKGQEDRISDFCFHSYTNNSLQELCPYVLDLSTMIENSLPDPDNKTLKDSYTWVKKNKAR